MKHIVIDCDPGIDDAQAIMMAYMHPDVKIEAITTVAGNVGIDHTSRNALSILDILDADPIPVFIGAGTALVNKGENASDVHGEDGLRGAIVEPTKRQFETEPAALALIELAKGAPGELELIAIGPLTNLALALRLDPDLPSRYKQLVIMGGAHFAQGNTVNLPAEFNIFADPDAASVVFDNWPGLTMVSWEATMSHGIAIEDHKALFVYDNPRSRFLEQIIGKNLVNREMSYAADPLAMAVLIEPEIVIESTRKYVQVECMGRLTRGMTVVDWRGKTKQPPNTTIVLKVDIERFYQLLKQAVQ